MRHVSQQMISLEVRRPHLKRRRRVLQKQLRNPGADMETRRRIERQIRNLGEPKVYSADDPPPPGAIDPGPMPIGDVEMPSDPSHETLSAMPHTQLYLFAVQQGLEVHSGNTKVQVIETILKHLRREQGELQ